MRLFSLNNLPFIIELPFIYKPVNIFKYFNHFMLSERLFKQVKIKFCPATFQSPPISPSHLPSLDSHHFAVGMRIAYLRCICVFIIYMHCQRGQVGSCHLSCTWLTGPPNHPPFSPHPPPPPSGHHHLLAVHSVVTGDCFMRLHRHRSDTALLHI